MAYYLDPGSKAGPQFLWFDFKVTADLNILMQGEPVPKAAVSGTFRIGSKHTKLPDFICFDALSFGASSVGLEILDRHAPRDIQAFPINVVDKNNDAVPGQFYYVNVLAFRNSLILDETNTSLMAGPSGAQWLSVDHRKLKMRKRDLDGAFIWHEEWPSNSPKKRHELFLSDQLVSIAKSERLSGLRYIEPIHEV